MDDEIVRALVVLLRRKESGFRKHFSSLIAAKIDSAVNLWLLLVRDNEDPLKWREDQNIGVFATIDEVKAALAVLRAEREAKG